MTERLASVWLEDVRVGELHQDADEYIEFHPDLRWQDAPGRPVLGQWFEDRPGKRQRGRRQGDLPSFFANLIPEGDLGLILRARLGIADGDDLGLLAATAPDLPGAVVVRPEDGFVPIAATKCPTPEAVEGPSLRFSLAGVQLKFSMLRSGGRLAFPGVGERGDVIAKVAKGDYPGLCENEYVTMEWARRSGFEVPACELRTLADLVEVPHEGDPAEPVFVIDRYDRAGPTRIHQEDLMQALGRSPWPLDNKYHDATYEGIASLLSGVVGPTAFDEVLRRLAFMVASGNNDAHLKNWSLLYSDRVNARLTPLYDQTFAGQWPKWEKTLALNLGGTTHFAAIDVRRFQEVARRCDRDDAAAAEAVTACIDRIAAAWAQVRRELPVPEPYRASLRRHWAAVPLLAPHALLIA